MSIANRLYDRSHGFVGDVSASNPSDLPSLYVDGKLINALPNAQYEGRLQIHNAIGKCSVKLLSGNLPNGYTISVDNDTQEVVIKWPGFKSGTVDIPNANFSSGDDGSWELGAGWTIMSGVTAPDPNDSGNTQAQFAGVSGESTIFNKFVAPVSDTVHSITASCDVQQGGSSANKAGAAVRILFYDEVGFQTGGADGNVIKSGSNSEWATSSLSTSIPAGTKFAVIGAAAFRNKQNRALWVDNFKWNLVQSSVGVSVEGSIPLSLQVADSDEREANWSGSILVKTWTFTFNSTPGLAEAGTTAGGFITADETNKTILVGGSTHIFQSTDGKNWSQTTSSPPIASQVRQLRCTNSAWFTLINDGSNNAHLYASTDRGISWTERFFKRQSDGFNFAIDMGTMITSDTCILMADFFGMNIDGVNRQAIYSTDSGVTWQTSVVPAGFNPGDSSVFTYGIYIPEWEMWVCPGQGRIYTASGVLPSVFVDEGFNTNRIGPCAYSPQLDALVVAGQNAIYTKQGKNGSWSSNLWPVGSSGQSNGFCWVERGGFFFMPVSTTNGNALISFDGFEWNQVVYTRSGGGNLSSENAFYVPWLGQVLLLFRSATPFTGYISDI